MAPPTANWRLYTAPDEERVLGMMEVFCREGEFEWDREVRRANLRYVEPRPEVGRVWLILDGAEQAGFVTVAFSFSFEFGGRDAFVDEIYLEPVCRRRGFGKATLDFVESELRAAGVRQLHLEADLTDRRLQPFYESSGFRERGYRLFTKKLFAGGSCHSPPSNLD